MSLSPGDTIHHKLGFTAVLIKRKCSSTWSVKIKTIDNPALNGFKSPGDSTWIFTKSITGVEPK